MIVYQARYQDSEGQYFYGDLYLHKEDCQKEIQQKLNPEVSKEFYKDCILPQGFQDEFYSEEGYECWKECVLANTPIAANIREMLVY